MYLQPFCCQLLAVKDHTREKLSFFVWAQGIGLWAEVTWAKFCSFLTICTVQKCNTGFHHCQCPGRSWMIMYRVSIEEISLWLEVPLTISKSLFMLQILFLTPQILRASSTFLCYTYHGCNYYYTNSVDVSPLNQTAREATELFYSPLCLLRGAKGMATKSTH